ncbi:putative CLIP-associating protein 1-A [Apostichopus japonicus]|uniref:Putative CLIP-associating protein 1-A n=1 Tax=Stichopus japonicus TaxID=307972 RepID=A0A2G8L9G8_STIJA|nr:putative CLIP-associating protein 1-A [Apostichopus japonicus]
MLKLLASLQLTMSTKGLISEVTTTDPLQHVAPPAGEPVNGSSPNLDEMDSDEIMKSLRQTTAEIQSFMSNSRDDLDKLHKPTSPRMDSDQVSADSGLNTSMPDIRVDSPEGKVMEYMEFGSPNGSVLSFSSPPPVSEPPLSPVFCSPSSSSSPLLHDAQSSSPLSELHVSNIHVTLILLLVLLSVL